MVWYMGGICNQNPKPELVLFPFPSLLPFSVTFLHRLQTSITQSFIKLECFLRPFLRTKCHDRSAHTFRPSLRFLEVPQKGLKKMICWHFLTTFLTCLVLSDPLQLFKSPGSWHECRPIPIYGLHFVYIVFYPLCKKVFWGVQTNFITSFWPF